MVAGAALLALGATGAAAKSSGCRGETLSWPFSAFGDHESYFLIPYGGFTQDGTGWQFAGGASVVSDPSSPTGFAAELPPGASATTPSICVAGNAPTARMFGETELAVGQHGNPTLRVEVLYTRLTHSHGKTVATHAQKPVGRVPKLSSWSPTRKISLSQGVLKARRGAAWVRYRFTAPSGATWLIDDVFVDPHMKG